MKNITSKDNSVIKQAAMLNKSAKERRKSGLMLLEGLRICTDAAKSGYIAKNLLFTETALTKYESELKIAIENAEDVYVISDALARYISDTQHTQGVFSIIKRRSFSENEISFDANSKFIMLENLQDPGNMGTIIRCAEAFGMTAVVVSRDSVDVYSPKVLRSTMGSVLRMPIVEVDDIQATITEMKDRGTRVYGAILDRSSVRPSDMEISSGGIAVVIGNEGNGLRKDTYEKCSGTVFIPMTENIESLNAASAATVLMWEMSQK